MRAVREDGEWCALFVQLQHCPHLAYIEVNVPTCRHWPVEEPSDRQRRGKYMDMLVNLISVLPISVRCMHFIITAMNTHSIRRVKDRIRPALMWPTIPKYLARKPNCIGIGVTLVYPCLQNVRWTENECRAMTESYTKVYPVQSGERIMERMTAQCSQVPRGCQ